MGAYTKTAFRLFGQLSENISHYFPDTRKDLKVARFKTSFQEYLSTTMLTCLIFFLVGLPVLSVVFSLLFKTFLLGFITAFTISIFLAILFFYISLIYPNIIAKGRAKELEKALPFASLYLSTVSGSKLPLYKTLEIFSKFSGYGEIAKEVNLINQDMKMFGFDVNTALERAVERSPSRDFKELLWGILSTARTGGDMSQYLKEKSKNFIDAYRRKLYEYSHTLTLYIEIYLTAIVLGVIFFTILTSIVSGIGGAPSNIVVLQFFLIFLFIPMISILFIYLIKATAPSGE